MCVCVGQKIARLLNQSSLTSVAVLLESNLRLKNLDTFRLDNTCVVCLSAQTVLPGIHTKRYL